MVIDVGQISELVEGYRRAADQLDGLTDPVERAVGRATLGRNATATLKHLSTKSRDLDESSLTPLRHWLAEYVGEDELSEVGVGGVESAVQTSVRNALKLVARWVWPSHLPAAVGGTTAIVVGEAFHLMDVSGRVWTTLVLAIAIGVVPGAVLSVILRSVMSRGADLSNAARPGWNSACSLGLRAKKILEQTSLQAERALWSAAGGRRHPGVLFVAEARTRARTIIGVTVALAVLGALLLGYGVTDAYRRWDAISGSLG